MYDIENDRVEEIDFLPQRFYWDITGDRQILIIEDRVQNRKRTVTLNSMAEKNEYAQKLSELSKRKNWEGKSLTYRLFSEVKADENQIYILCQVSNWRGDSWVVVFRYDMDSENVYYVTAMKTGESVSSFNYSFVPKE